VLFHLNEPERPLSKLIRVIETWREKHLNLVPFSEPMALETLVLRHEIHSEMSSAKKIDESGEID
jgi:hypothetical protein